MQKPLEILRSKFGYKSFRLQQEEIIQNVLEGKDILALMPTGGGKSLCYQIPAVMLEGATVVVSPLIALMKDQVDALKLNGIPAAYLNSSLSPTEQREVLDQLANNKLKLLYLAPERLMGKESSFVHFLKKVNVSLLAIDEAHCISQWGHDFRPEYAMLASVKNALEIPTIALTATADQLTRKDILEKLKLETPKVFISSFNRENIHYHVTPKRESYGQLLRFLENKRENSGIIYVLSRSSAEDLADRLTQEGFSAKPYHAGLEKVQKEQHQDMFLRDEVKIIVATIAFGMGINKSNVRFVVHMDLPKSIESYYQETGRAGRDGLKSDALLFYSYGDVVKLKKFVEVEGNEEQSQIMQKKLQEMATFGELRVCRRKYLLQYFGEVAEDYCGSCDICLSEYEKFDGTIMAQKVLSAVARLEERFGVSYVIDFLRGSKSEKIWLQHKKLKTYGIGADTSKKEWNRYVDHLLYLEYLKKADGQFPVLQLTEKSWKVLRGEEKVMLVKDVTPKETITEKVVIPLEEELLVELKELRRQLAQKENVPAYIIFSDATLHELATYLPSKIEELHHISGFGEVKINRYGEDFLAVVRNYIQKYAVDSRISEAKVKKKKKRSIEKVTDTKEESLRLFQKGKSVDEIARSRNLQLSTIYGHLTFYVDKGKLDAENLVTKEKIKVIEQAIRRHGDIALKPIKEELGEEVSYEEIRIVRGAWMHKQRLKKG